MSGIRILGAIDNVHFATKLFVLFEAATIPSEREKIRNDIIAVGEKIVPQCDLDEMVQKTAAYYGRVQI